MINRLHPLQTTNFLLIALLRIKELEYLYGRNYDLHNNAILDIFIDIMRTNFEVRADITSVAVDISSESAKIYMETFFPNELEVYVRNLKSSTKLFLEFKLQDSEFVIELVLKSPSSRVDPIRYSTAFTSLKELEGFVMAYGNVAIKSTLDIKD